MKRVILNIDLVSSMKNRANSGLSLNDSLPTKSAYRLLAFYFGCFMLMLDFWKDIKNYEDKYSGSYWGNIRSWDRVINTYGGRRKYLRKGRILKTSLNANGYLTVALCNGVARSKRVNRLIAETFIPNPNNYPEVNHKTPIKTINFACNLEWCSRSQNMKHAYKNGLSSQIGETHYRSKLTEKQVKEIKLKSFMGYKTVFLRKEYNVTKQTINDIKAGRSWKEVV